MNIQDARTQNDYTSVAISAILPLLSMPNLIHLQFEL